MPDSELPPESSFNLQDSDDLFSLNKLEVQAKLLEQTGADIAFSPWVKLKIESDATHLWQITCCSMKNAAEKLSLSVLVVARLVNRFSKFAVPPIVFGRSWDFIARTLILGGRRGIIFQSC